MIKMRPRVAALATCPRCAMHCSLTPSLRSSDFHVTELWQQGMSMTYDRFQPKRVQMRTSNEKISLTNILLDKIFG